MKWIQAHFNIGSGDMPRRRTRRSTSRILCVKNLLLGTGVPLAAVNDIDHTKTKAKSPQPNGICERFHKTLLQEFYQVTFRKKIYADVESLQHDLDEWLTYYNTGLTHQGKMCCGRTPLETLEDGKRIWQEKKLA